ncbi:hypothetical protein, partial [Rhodovulum sp. 12E13]|uniref:hypothetical protein n=1 Tax=Rhodovulum sp. 12E13 TaxID=2203891 RepID=UPI001F4704B1
MAATDQTHPPNNAFAPREPSTQSPRDIGGAATIFGFLATRAASQRFGLPPFLTTQRITLVAR